MNKKLFAFVLIGLAVLVGIFYFLKPKAVVEIPLDTSVSEVVSDNKKIFNIEIKEGKITSPENVFKVSEGDEITISAISETDEEIHFHGFDKMLMLKKNIKNETTFSANITGRFEFELEKTGKQLGIIEVHPK